MRPSRWNCWANSQKWPISSVSSVGFVESVVDGAVVVGAVVECATAAIVAVLVDGAAECL